MRAPRSGRLGVQARATWAIAFLTIATIGVGFFQYQIFSHQLDAMQGQLDQMAAAERPWIMVTGIEPQGLWSDDKEGVSFSVKFLVKNVGHSPAQNVSVSGKLLINDLTQPPRRGQVMVEACEEAKRRFIYGRLIFPDQPQYIGGELPERFNIPAKEVWAVRAARIKSAEATHHVNPELTKERVAWESALPFAANFDLVGCVNYRSENARRSTKSASWLMSEQSQTAEASRSLLGNRFQTLPQT